MPDIQSQIKMALTAARDMSAANEERQKDSVLPIATLSELPQIRAHQHAIQNLIMSFLTKTGFEIDKFEKIQTQHQTELRRIVEEQKAEAIKHSSSAKNRLRTAAESYIKAFETIADPSVVFLNPFLIWGYGIPLESSNIEQWKSSAKFRFDESFIFRQPGQLTFYFLWDNPNNQWTVINVDGSLILNGYCQLRQGGTIFNENTKNLYLTPALYLMEYWNQPPTSPPTQYSQRRTGLSLEMDTGFFLSNEIKSESISKGFNLNYILFAIPPLGTAVFEVALEIGVRTDEDFLIDFASGDFEVVCPGVMIRVLNLP